MTHYKDKITEIFGKEFVDELEKYSKDNPFIPGMIEYDDDGDEIEAFLSTEQYYGKNLNRHLTLYRDRIDHSVVGFCVHGVKPLIRKSNPKTLYREIEKDWIQEKRLNLYLDIDGTITRYPEFFSQLSHCWKGNVYVITYRPSLEYSEQDCRKHKIRYTDIKLARDEDDKAKIIEELGDGVFFDDDPDFIVHVKSKYPCMLVRNEDNFDYDDRKFLFTESEGRIQLQPFEIDILKEGIDRLKNNVDDEEFCNIVRRLTNIYD